MIRYDLHCPDDHRFDSWFQSVGAFDALAAAGHLSCPVCGSNRVEKALMAPSVRAARAAVPNLKTSELQTPDLRTTDLRTTDLQTQDLRKPDLRTPAAPREAALAALRREVAENADYVGENFVAEARAMHEGEAPERSIYGEARLDEARQLLEEGVPVAPLPFLPMRKVN